MDTKTHSKLIKKTYPFAFKIVKKMWIRKNNLKKYKNKQKLDMKS